MYKPNLSEFISLYHLAGLWDPYFSLARPLWLCLLNRLGLGPNQGRGSGFGSLTEGKSTLVIKIVVKYCITRSLIHLYKYDLNIEIGNRMILYQTIILVGLGGLCITIVSESGCELFRIIYPDPQPYCPNQLRGEKRETHF